MPGTPAVVQRTTCEREQGGPASRVNPIVLIHPSGMRGTMPLGGNYAFAPETGAPNAHNLV